MSQYERRRLGEWKCFPSQPGLFSTASSLLVFNEGHIRDPVRAHENLPDLRDPR